MKQKLKAFLTMDFSTKLLMLEAYLFLAIGRIYKLMPFHKVSPSLGNHNHETSFTEKQEERRELAKISQTIHLMSKYTLWESQCLVRAIAGMKMLERRKMESTLYLGTGKDEQGKFVAHAWLRSGPYYISGAEGMEKFTVVSTFANTPVKQKHVRKQEGENYG